jgi:hypothetical protein
MNEPFSEELISAYLDGEITSAERVRVEQWLAASADNQRLFDDLRQMRSELQALPRPSLPHNFRDRVLAAIETRTTPDSNDHVSASHEAHAFPTHPTIAPAQPLPSWQWFSAGLAATLLLGFVALVSQPTPTAYTLTQATPTDQKVATTNGSGESEVERIAPPESLKAAMPMEALPSGDKAMLPELAKIRSSPDLRKEIAIDGQDRNLGGATKFKESVAIAPMLPGNEVRDTAGVARSDMPKFAERKSGAVGSPRATLKKAAREATMESYLQTLPMHNNAGVLEVYVTTTADHNIRDWFAQRVATAAYESKSGVRIRGLSADGVPAKSDLADGDSSTRSNPQKPSPFDSENRSSLDLSGGGGGFGAAPATGKSPKQNESAFPTPALEWEGSAAELQAMLSEYQEAFPQIGRPELQFVATAEATRDQAESARYANGAKGQSAQEPASRPKSADQLSMQTPIAMDAKPASAPAASDKVASDRPQPIVAAAKSITPPSPTMEKQFSNPEQPLELTQNQTELRKMQLERAKQSATLTEAGVETNQPSIARSAPSPTAPVPSPTPALDDLNQLPAGAVPPGATDQKLKVRFIFVPDKTATSTLDK